MLEIVDKGAPDPFTVVEPCRDCRDLRSSCATIPKLAMDCLSNEIGVDHKERIEVVYHLLYSYSKRYGVVLKVKLPRDNPVGRDG